jgi:hypothetical protein
MFDQKTAGNYGMNKPADLPLAIIPHQIFYPKINPTKTL